MTSGKQTDEDLLASVLCAPSSLCGSLLVITESKPVVIYRAKFQVWRQANSGGRSGIPQASVIMQVSRHSKIDVSLEKQRWRGLKL